MLDLITAKSPVETIHERAIQGEIRYCRHRHRPRETIGLCDTKSDGRCWLVRPRLDLPNDPLDPNVRVDVVFEIVDHVSKNGLGQEFADLFPCRPEGSL